MNRDHNQQYQTPPNQTRDGIQLNVDSLICALRIEDFEHRIKRPRAVLAEGESEANDEQYPEVLKMWMKRTVFENVSQISDMINRRPQYVMKFLNHELGKTCFYNIQTDTGVILHSPIPTYKQLLTRQMHPEEYEPIPEPPSNYVVNLDNIDQTATVINELLGKYVEKYVRCPACDSTNTMNPISDAQQEEENMSFGISCKDCEQTTEMSVEQDPFLLAISASRVRNNSMQQNHPRTRRTQYNGYQQGYYRNNAGQYFYGFPAQYYNGAYYAAPYAYYPYAAQQYYYQAGNTGDQASEQQQQQYNYYMQRAYGYNNYSQPEEEKSPPHDASEQEPQYKSAGVLPYCRDPLTGRLLVLLGKENRGSNPNKPVAETAIVGRKTRPTWSEFGGKKNKQDVDAVATAAREFTHETCGAFDEELSLANSQQMAESLLRKEDALTVYNKNGKYQLYLLPVSYVKKEKFVEARKASQTQTEKVDFEWVDGESLLNLICGSSDFKNKMISPESGLLQWKENEELHPFFLTLFRGAKSLIKTLVQENQKYEKKSLEKPIATNGTATPAVGKEGRKKKSKK